jgi:hypothetical protein
MKNIIICFCFLFVFFLSCNNDDFSPYEETQDKIAVYCILDSRTDTQYVKVQRSYTPDKNNNDYKKLPGKTTVYIEEIPGRMFYFRDTIIKGIDNFSMFYITGFTPKRSQSYFLIVKNEYLGNAGSSLTTWGPSGLKFIYLEGYDNYLVVNLSNYYVPSFLWSFHLYVDYNIISDGRSLPKKIEIPEYYYTRDCIGYKYDDIKSVLEGIPDKKEPSNIIIKKGYFVQYMHSGSLMDYLDRVRGFADQYSLRFDEYFYSNISNVKNKKVETGIGIFGELLVDTIYFKVKDKTIKELGYINGQDY